jgi:hypothetical protein
MDNPAAELASTIQSAHIKRNPDPAHDINPSTAASAKIPALLESVSPPQSPRSDDSLSTIPSDVIRPRPRTRSFPPIPDFRFEQSYLASIEKAPTNWQVAYITIRDQVLSPLAQGIAWNLIMFGWRHWNRGSKFQGRTWGAKVRKWWWGVNNWKIPPPQDSLKVQSDRESLQKAQEFFVDKFGSSMGD